VTESIIVKAKVGRVEERFEKVITDIEKYGEAKAEGKAEGHTDRRSIGWWLSLEGWGVALGVGREKPGFSAGDEVTVRIEK